MNSATLYPPRLGPVYVQQDQQDQHRFCFESKFWETAERRGGTRMGLSERYDAVLSEAGTELGTDHTGSIKSPY